MSKEPEHLIDYDTLKEWGFVWSAYQEYSGKDYYTKYIIQDTSHTDLHNFTPILLSWYPHHHLNVVWIMSYLTDTKSSLNTLFVGRIADKEALLEILKACIVYKPSELKQQTMAKIETPEIMARLAEGDVVTEIEWSADERYYYLGLFENEKNFKKQEIKSDHFDKIKYELVAFVDDNGYLNYKI